MNGIYPFAVIPGKSC